jgi:hypothetical protein
MVSKKTPLLIFLLALLITFSPGLDLKSESAQQGQKAQTGGENIPRSRTLQYLRQHHPELLQLISDIRKMEEQARNLARAHARRPNEDEKRAIEDRIRYLLEDTLRLQFEMTDRTLESLVMRYEELRERHERNRGRFDEIVEQRLVRLLSRQP